VSGRRGKQGVKPVFRDRSSNIQGMAFQRLFLFLSFLLSLLSLGSEGSARGREGMSESGG